MSKVQHISSVIWWRRLGGWLLDIVLIGVIARAVAVWCIQQFTWTQMSFWIAAGFVAVPLSILGYYLISEWVWGRTLGKALTRTRVVEPTGDRPLSGNQILKRSLARFILWDPLTFFARHPRGWHDKLSGTVVTSLSETSTLGDNDEKPRKGLRRWWQRFWISISVFFWLAVCIVPVWTVHRWMQPRPIATDVENWQRYSLSPNTTLRLPRQLQGGEGRWYSRLVGLQHVTIVQVSNPAEVARLVSGELRELGVMPVTTLQLGSFEQSPSSDRGAYSYQLTQTPVTGGGFWFQESDGVYYLVRFTGFGVELGEVLEVMAATVEVR